MAAGRKEGSTLKTAKIDRDCFDKAIKAKNLSIRGMGRDDELGISDRTLRRYREQGEITPQALETLARYLNVSVDFLSGKYSRMIEGSVFDEELKEQCRKDLKPERFPYQPEVVREVKYKDYLESLLIIHGLSWEHYEKLGPETRHQMELDLENSILAVLYRYFQSTLNDEMLEFLNFPLIHL